jgi:glycosyltransferase involved in cell wall biosynthesis
MFPAARHFLRRERGNWSHGAAFLINPMRLTVVVPLYNEEESIPRLHEAIVEAVDPLGIEYEMVFVNDGSRDKSFAVATECARRDGRLRIVNFRRNYGQTAAMAAGIEHARGEIVVTMDGDLQNDPRDIGLLLEKMSQGYDIVVGWRFNRQDKLVSRKIPSRIANWLIGKVTGVPIKDNGCSLKAFRANLIKEIPLYSEMHRFIPAMASVTGPRIAEIKVRHHARQFGTSKYGLSRIYKVLLDLLVIKTIASFTSRPLVWFVTLSLPALVCALVGFGYSIYAVFSGQPFSLPITGSALIFFASALMSISSGMLGELTYLTGDVREHHFARLTQRIEPAGRANGEG